MKIIMMNGTMFIRHFFHKVFASPFLVFTIDTQHVFGVKTENSRWNTSGKPRETFCISGNANEGPNEM